MKRLVLLGALGLSVACLTPTQPSSTSEKNCDPPAASKVHFDPEVYGRVTIFNASRCANDYSLSIWKTNGSEALLQRTVVGQATVTLLPDQIATLAVDIPEECTIYQVDLYFGTKTADPSKLRRVLAHVSRFMCDR